MSNKLLEIKITKATLFLYEQELLKVLPEKVFIQGLKRGKAILRSRQAKERSFKDRNL